MILFVFIVSTCFLPHVYNGYSRPSYQVHLHSKNNSGYLLDNICYGNILQSHIVLTAASCLLAVSEFPYKTKLIQFDKIFVSFKSEDMNDLIVFVSSIHVYPKFDYFTLDHDIALVNLSSPLPLSLRDDVNWILLPKLIINTESFLEEDTNIWRNSYTENKLRGYGVLSANNLVAIVTLAPRIDKLRDKNETNIFDGYKNRITLLFPYLSWIFEILEEAEITDIQTGISTNSLPYTERKNAEMVRQYEVSGSFISAAHPCNVTGIVTLILALHFLHFLN
ncbi:uncharacterized protein LOC108161329 isoform X1 [Drosophila miranda]|uniref:uncharacterized protein LOC108161329 isoform X1 n=1 Tax=Drosophila miranda TaxID=7229 RepID=UPI0007E689F7|nr:uncharacterized protein LOC108161329 isoform X1 [Drosophila miranda]